jgi:hypothetical protein
MPDRDVSWQYAVRWPDGSLQAEHVPDIWIDMIPFMAARVLLSQGYDAARPFIVRLLGADYDLCRSTLGAVAATPLVNTGKPVTHPTTCVFREGQRRRHDEAAPADDAVDDDEASTS